MTPEQAAQRLQRFGKMFTPMMEEAMLKVALGVEKRAKANLANVILKRRTGVLASSVNHRVESYQGSVSAIVGSPLIYARPQELGGTMYPGNGKMWLTIPTGPALTSTGVARGPARSFPGLRFQPTERGNLAFLVKDTPGRHARSEIYFRLVKKVTIKPKHWLRRSMEEELPRFQKIIGDTIAVYGDKAGFEVKQ